MADAEKQAAAKETARGEAPLPLESAADAAKHRKERGEEEPVSPRRAAYGGHIDVGGVADFGPVDTERMARIEQEKK